MISLHDTTDVLVKDLDGPSEILKAAAFLDQFVRGDNGRTLNVQFSNLDIRVQVALVFLHKLTYDSPGERRTLGEIVIATSHDEVAARKDKERTIREGNELSRQFNEAGLVGRVVDSKAGRKGGYKLTPEGTVFTKTAIKTLRIRSPLYWPE